MQNCNAKIKAIFILALSFLVFSGCAKNDSLTKKDNIVSKKTETVWTSDVQNKKPVKMLFVGDMMFDRYIREVADKKGYDYIFENIKELLAGEDLAIGNLEGPITDKNSVSVGSELGESKNFVFTFDPAVAKALFDNNIKLVNLGNNHILNQGEEGVFQTKKYLDDAEVQYFGDIGEMEVEPPRGGSTSRVVEINGIRIGLVNYNYTISNSAETAIENIRKINNQTDVAIICPHWGTEYKVGDPGNNIRNLAYQFINAGADLIIGTHPHVVQDSEVYQGKKIYYSLGNFIFDQYFQKETKEGLAVEVTIDPKDFSLDLKDIPLVIQTNGQTKIK